MNRTYALVWNPSLATWTVAHEHARRRGKGAGAVLAAALLLPAMVFAADLPTGGQVASGSGQIGTPSNNQMVIDQASNKLAIDWQSFDIAAGNKVTFHQPGRDAIALNRVLGSDGSKIMGQLDANGRVFIVNPNGVLFGANAQVNVGALVASTLDISNSDFEAGNYRFKGDGSNARVINNGQITAADGGSVALLGGTVSNNGVIVANQGTVALAAGNAVTLDFAGDGLLNVQVDEAVVDALVENQQLIKADGGQVLLTANAGDALLKTVVNNTGVIEAQTLGEKDGKIVLLGSFDGGTVQVAGTLDASAPDGGNGGFIDTSGAHVKVADGAKVTTKAADGKTGTWLIDPTDFTVSAGSAIQTNSGIGATTLSNNLNNTSVTLQTVASGSEDGDINVNAAVTWNAGTTLTLSAHNDININAAITAQNANGKVALQYGQASTDGGTADYHIKAPINLQSGNNFSTRKGSTGSLISYTVVNDANALQAMSSTLGGNYALGSDIDLSSITNWTPVGSSDSSQFTGELAGLGHTLSNLTIDRSSTDYVGLFGYTSYISVIRDIGLVDGSVTGNNRVGGLVGDNYGTISNAYATGSVSGSEHVGGLVGHNDGTISNAYATGSVTGNNRVGGLVGYNDYGTLRNAYATGSVTGSEYVGGLVGYNDNTISNAYATGSVTGSSDVGGLVGNNDYGTISNAYWDSISTEQNNALGGGSGTGTDISSNRYNHSGYTGLGTWALVTGTSNVYAASDSNGVQWIMIEGQTRPFLASEYSTSISNAHQLQLMAYNLGANYTLAGDIDASATAGSNLSDMWSTSGFVPVGDNANKFGGQINGNGHVITGLTIDRSATDYVGLFGYIDSASRISDIGLVGGSVSGRNNVGGLVGLVAFNGATVNNAFVTANVSGADYVGGLAGHNQGTISNAYATGNVSGSNYLGGLAGYNNQGIISNAYATGDVSSIVAGNSYLGGLVGLNTSGTISNAYAIGSVSGNGYVGGLVGYNALGTISYAYTTGSVSGGSYVGGLAGYNTGNISNAYAIGSVSGNGYVGGLVGYNLGRAISNAYATGSVSGSNAVGGLVGYNDNGNISNSFYATTEAGGNAINDSGATANEFSGNTNGTGTTWAQLTQSSTFTGWDIASTGGSSAVWRIYDGYSAPLLRSFLQSITLTADASGGSKTYNGTAATGTTTYTGSDLDTSKLLGTLGYASNSKNAGTYSSADGSLILSGLYSGQQGYDISYADTSLTISKAALAITGISALNKTYDATTHASLTGSVAVNVLGSDIVSVSGTGIGSFADANADSNKAVTVSGYSLTGADAGNYNLLQPTGVTASINKADLTLSGSKVYDGSTSVAGSTLTATGVAGQTFTVTGSGDASNLASKNVQSGSALASTMGLSLGSSSNGGLASNYNAPGLAGSSYTVTAKGITLIGITAADKTYDATTTATLNTAALGYSGVIGGDIVALAGSGSGSFATKNVGTNKTVTVSGYSLIGDDAGNYVVTQPTGLTASVSKANLAVSGIAAVNKTYDATTGATLSGTAAVSALGSDIVSVTGTGAGSFADANAGVGKAVTVTGYALTGSDADNYNLVQPTGLTASINKADLTLSGSKVYDGSTAVAGSTLTATGVAGQTFTVTGSGDASNLASKNVQSGTTLGSATGLTLGSSSNGGLSSNYNLLGTSGSSYTVTAKGITLTGITAADKTYDATTAATLNTANVAYSGMINGDDLSLGGSGSGSFATKDVGTNKAVTVSGYSLSGADAGNYVVTQPTGLTASITKADLVVSGVSSVDKTYDATTNATLTGSASVSALQSDVVSVAGTGTGSFADANVGVGKAVTVTGYALTGSDADNYNLVQPTGLTASINKADVTLSGSKVYDGSTAVAGSTLTATGVAGQTFTVTGSGDASNLASKNVQSGTTLGSTTGLTLGSSSNGGLSSNYNLLSTSGSSYTVTAKGITLTGITAADKTYDATTAATLNTANVAYSGMINGDDLSLGGSGSGSFATKDVGTNKTVTVSGYSLSGADAGNYVVTQPTGLTATISKADLLLTGLTTANKIYDATTTATLSGTASLAAALGSDVVSLNGTGTGNFADTNVGTNKAVTVSGYTLSGTDAGNYNIAQPNGLTASIDKADLTITANDASKIAGQSIALSGYSASGLVGNDSVTSVSLSSLGQPTTAPAGSYAIIASDAIGAALSNYNIDYQDGTLLVTAAASEPTTASSQPYISVLASNGQTASTEAKQQTNESEAFNQNMLITNPLNVGLNLQVISDGIRLPEGI